MKSTGTRKDVTKGATIGRVIYGMKPKHLKGIVTIQPEEDKLIGLLDAGRIDEFRQRLHASRMKRRKQFVARVISGREPA